MRFQNAFYSGMVRVMKGMRKKEMESESDSDSEERLWWSRGSFIGKRTFDSLSLSVYIAKPTLEITCFPSNLPLKALFSISLLNEKRILDALTGFPHVVQSFALDITATKKGDTVYNLFLEFASGGSLLWI